MSSIANAQLVNLTVKDIKFAWHSLCVPFNFSLPVIATYRVCVGNRSDHISLPVTNVGIHIHRVLMCENMHSSLKLFV